MIGGVPLPRRGTSDDAKRPAKPGFHQGVLGAAYLRQARVGSLASDGQNQGFIVPSSWKEASLPDLEGFTRVRLPETLGVLRK
jgi:hypothetical protein